MTNQEIFDKAVRHLLTQKEKSMAEGRGNEQKCLYRGPNGLKCAVGAFITDEEYCPAMDEGSSGGGYTAQQLHNRFQIEAITDYNVGLFDALQDIHDWSPVEKWWDKLDEMADRRGFDKSVLNAFKE